MSRHSVTWSLFALTAIVLLSSCSSDNEGASDALDATPLDGMTDTPDGTGSSEGSGQNPSTPDVDLATRPVFNITTCDAAPAPEDTATSFSVSAPARFVPDTLVAGRLSPDSTNNNTHYWSVDLEAGIYHLIVESRISSGASSNIGLMVESIDAAGDRLERLIRSNEIDHRFRALNTLTLMSATTLRLKITPVFNQEDYLMGIFSNGTPVASPLFPDSTPASIGCPEIRTLPIDTTESFLLRAGGNSGSNDVWFQSTLDIADYTLFAMAVVESGDRTNIQFSATSYDQFGQVARDETLIRANAIDTVFNTSGTLQPADGGLYWIRFRNRNSRVTLNLSTNLALN